MICKLFILFLFVLFSRWPRAPFRSHLEDLVKELQESISKGKKYPITNRPKHITEVRKTVISYCWFVLFLFDDIGTCGT
jgi:hypothetical protein